MMNPAVLVGGGTLVIALLGRFLWSKFQNLPALLCPILLVIILFVAYISRYDFSSGMKSFLLIAVGIGYVAGGLLGLVLEYCFKKEPFGFIQ